MVFTFLIIVGKSPKMFDYIKNMKFGVFIDQDNAGIPIDVINILKRLNEECVEDLVVNWELYKFEVLKLIDPE